jgi:hypothetical protein
MQYELDRISSGKKEPSLAEMTRKAIKMLQTKDKGFFLFVEGTFFTLLGNWTIGQPFLSDLCEE